MSLIAALETISRQVRTYKGQYQDALTSVLAGGGLFGILCSILVFQPHPWWNPRTIIPTVGMLIGNSISGPSVALDRFLSTIAEQKHEVEVRLCFGGNGYESTIAVIRSSMLAGLLPTLNMMAVVGLVSIPGMMTGQLLGGASPLVAAEYQMIIFWIICTTNTTAIYAALTLANRHAVIDNKHRLTLSRIEKTGGKLDIDVAIVRIVKNIKDVAR